MDSDCCSRSKFGLLGRMTFLLSCFQGLSLGESDLFLLNSWRYQVAYLLGPS